MKTAIVNKKAGTVTIDGVPYKIGEVVKQKLTPEERFLELVEGAVRTHDFKKHPDVASEWKKDGEVIIKEWKDGNVWVDYCEIWTKISDEYNYNYDQIRDLCKDMLEKHFNLRGCETGCVGSACHTSWRNTLIC